MSGPVAKRYARALFALADEQGRAEACGEALGSLAVAFADERLVAFARGGALDVRARREAVAGLAKQLQLPAPLGSFLGLLAEKGRLGFLGSIAGEYGRLLDRKVGRVRARIRSARPLSAESVGQVRELFAGRSGKQVLAEVVVEPELIGGLVVEIEGRVFDGSLRSQIDRMNAALSG